MEELLKISLSFHVLHLCKITIYGFNFAKHHLTDINLPYKIGLSLMQVYTDLQNSNRKVYFGQYIAFNMFQWFLTTGS